MLSGTAVAAASLRPQPIPPRWLPSDVLRREGGRPPPVGRRPDRCHRGRRPRRDARCRDRHGPTRPTRLADLPRYHHQARSTSAERRRPMGLRRRGAAVGAGGITPPLNGRTGGRTRAVPSQRHGNRVEAPAAHLPRAHVRMPDERARLRAARPARGGRLHRRAGGPIGRRRRLQHLRGPGERGQPALRQPRSPAAGEGRTPACRSPSAAASRRRTAARSPAARRGSTSSSARTTSVRCRRCSTAPGTTTRRRWRSSSPSRLPVDAAGHA